MKGVRIESVAPVVALAIALMIAGCAKKPPNSGYSPNVDMTERQVVHTTSGDAIAPPSPEQELYEKFRSGSVQVAGVVDSVEEALQAANKAQSKASGDLKAALGDAIELMEDAGSSLGEHTADPPEFADFQKAFNEYEEKRLGAISDGNDALLDLRSALGIIDSQVPEVSGDTKQQLIDLGDLLQVAVQDLTATIEAFGGHVQIDD